MNQNNLTKFFFYEHMNASPEMDEVKNEVQITEAIVKMAEDNN